MNLQEHLSKELAEHNKQMNYWYNLYNVKLKQLESCREEVKEAEDNYLAYKYQVDKCTELIKQLK